MNVRTYSKGVFMMSHKAALTEARGEQLKEALFIHMQRFIADRCFVQWSFVAPSGYLCLVRCAMHDYFI